MYYTKYTRCPGPRLLHLGLLIKAHPAMYHGMDSLLRAISIKDLNLVDSVGAEGLFSGSNIGRAVSSSCVEFADDEAAYKGATKYRGDLEGDCRYDQFLTR
jgi:hypothetical protein